ncbi:serine hydrolase [Nibribacter ruber]|uniref:beta-lactamase n=2 Tax=Nibribacter ruber TaxID=2698458 RepID=A0A6P1P1I7_9BACT|nr:serine hydrolase [Nibribacter ruber]
MRLLSFLVFLTITFSGCTLSKPQPTMSSLKDRISAELSQQKGTFAVAFKDVQTGEEVLLQEHENFHAASTMKTPVLVEAYKQIEAGKFTIDSPIEVKNNFKSIADSSTFSITPTDDGDTELYQHLGKTLPMSDLLYRMIIKSSNLATNIIIELVGAENVTATMRNLGAQEIQVRRGVEDGKAYALGLNNTTTAYDLMLLYTHLVQGKAVSPAASQAMIKILLDQQYKDIIPAKLPKDVQVAHKTGWITGVRHDSGIVFLPDGRKYVLVLLSKQLEDEPAAISAMAQVSLLVYQHMLANH